MFIKFNVKKQAIAIVTVFLLVMIAILCHSRINYVTSIVTSTVKSLPIYSVAVDDDRKEIAISFDATWGSTHTKEILDILDENNIKTTFFLVNIWMKDNPEITREIVARGHEIGLHSTTHPKFTSLSDNDISKELSDNSSMIKDLTGKESKIFRLPFGDYDDRVVKKVVEFGYMPIQWSIDSLDWKDLSAAEIIARVSPAKSGDIVLFHNNGLNTAMALKDLLPQLKSQGYSIVPVSKLVYHDNYYVDYSGVQQRNISK